MQCILCAHEASHPALKPTDCILMLMSHHTAHDMLSICHVYIYIYKTFTTCITYPKWHMNYKIRYDAYLHVEKMNLLLCRLLKNVVLDSRIYRELKVDMNIVWKEKYHKWNKRYEGFI